MKKTLIFFIIFFLFLTLFSQPKYKQVYTKEELITITRDISIPEALRTLEIMSQQFEGRKIINMSTLTLPIGIPIKQLYWKDALELIIEFNDLILEEQPGVYLIKDLVTEEIIEEEIISEAEMISPDTRQIRISSIFFKADKSLLNNIGIDWSTLYSGEVRASLNFMGASKVTDELFTAAVTTTYESGDVSIDINTLFRIIESNQMGTIIANPTITVLTGKKGYIQIGEDFSVKTVDESGNVTDEFFTTGIILDVTPTILINDNKEVIHLVSTVEKSSATPGAISTVIHKSLSSTEVILFDGEETVIGNIYTTDETLARSGIPILKDLPWWFFGIRYLAGYNRVEKNVREMIIILKAKIIDSVEEREKKDISTKEMIKKIRDSNSEVNEMFNTEEKNTKKDIRNENTD